jgi:hypothetical protein
MTKGFERDDPFQMVAVGIAASEDTNEEMARTFIEEFALMGIAESRILRFFRSPFYAGPHMVYQERGEDFIRALIAEIFGVMKDGG